MLGLLAVVLLVAEGGCYKKFNCVDRTICVIYYKGTDTNIVVQSFVKDTSIYGKVPRVVDDGYDYAIIYDSTIVFELKARKKNLDQQEVFTNFCLPL